MDYSRMARKLREKIARFSGELSKGREWSRILCFLVEFDIKKL